MAALINAEVPGSRTALSRHQLLGSGARALAFTRWSASRSRPGALRPALCDGSGGLYGRQGQDGDRRAQSPKPGNEVQLHPWSAGAAPDEAAKRRSGCQSRCRADGMAAGGKAAVGGQAAHANVGAGLETSCPEQTGRWSTTLGAPGRSAWQLGEHRVGGWAHPVPELSGAPAVTTSRAALLRAHPDLTLRLPHMRTKAIALRVAQTIRRCAVGGI